MSLSLLCLLLLCMLFLIFIVLNICNFIQRTEQVLIELDISAIEDYILLVLLKIPLHQLMFAHIYLLTGLLMTSMLARGSLQSQIDCGLISAVKIWAARTELQCLQFCRINLSCSHRQLLQV